MKRFTLLFVLLLSLVFGFGNIIANNSSKPNVKVSIQASGKILLNGVESSLEDVQKKFSELKKNNGVVWYYRETAQAEPPKQAMQVINLVVEYSLPITMSSKPDFSDYIDQDGKSHPRK